MSTVTEGSVPANELDITSMQLGIDRLDATASQERRPIDESGPHLLGIGRDRSDDRGRAVRRAMNKLQGRST